MFALLNIAGCDEGEGFADGQVELRTEELDEGDGLDGEGVDGANFDAESDSLSGAPSWWRIQKVRQLLVQHNVKPIPKPPVTTTAQVELGRALFFDKILSGTKDVACATCHHPRRGSADNRPVFAGIHGTGIGLPRDGVLGGRHSQHVFNLHLLKDLTIDGKVEYRNGQYLALGLPLIPQDIQDQFEYGVVSAQAIMPIVTQIEMLGFPGENELSSCPPTDLSCSWDGVMARLGAIPQYVTMFEAAYPGESFADMTIAHVGNALAAFELKTFFFDNSPFDRFLRGDYYALSAKALAGAERFYDSTKGNCVSCHSGGAMTDNKYHKTATPQFGPGRSIPAGDGPNELDDFGRIRNTGNAAEKYAWRTAPLRNVNRTGPYGRLGQYTTLEGFIGRYQNVQQALVNYNIYQLQLSELWPTLLNNVSDVLANGIDPLLGTVHVNGSAEVAELAAFVNALTDPAAVNLGHVIPPTVPSGLPVDTGL